ncbi:hypothetical protein BgiBS90_024854, partial [Biomphalaria glabrata]
RHGDSKFTSKGVWGVGVEIRAWHPVSTSLMAQVKKHLERNVKNRGECGEGKQFQAIGVCFRQDCSKEAVAGR